MSDSEELDDDLGPSPAQIALCVLWAIVVAIGGGLLSGWLMTRFGTVGAIGLMLLGIPAGLVAWRITRRVWPPAGWMLIAALLVAFALANMFWLRYANFARGDNAKTWGEAIKMLFMLMNTSPQHFFITLVCAGFGAYNAYSSAGSRWHRVRE
jgi:hypothetical protein